MRVILTFFFFMLYFLLSPSFADRLIIEPDMGRAPLLATIANTKHSLHLVMYGFTDERLLEAILQAPTRDKTIQILLEATPYKAEDENNKTIAALKAAHIAWQGSLPPLKLIHQKTLVSDERVAIVMTFNFTHSSFKNERNFGLIIDDPKRIQEINAIFSADFNHVALPQVSADIILSPDNSREKLLTLIRNATQSIKIYAQNVSDYQLIGALFKAAKKGVKIAIITSRPLRQKQSEYLARAKVSIHQSKRLYIHAKVLIIDDKLAVIGSINFTRASLNQNRELAVISHDVAVINELNTVFAEDSHDAENITPKTIEQSSPNRLLHWLRLLEKFNVKKFLPRETTRYREHHSHRKKMRYVKIPVTPPFSKGKRNF